MNRILVCSEDALSTLRISRILTAGNHPFDVVKTPIRKDDLVNYQLMIVHSSYRLNALNQFIEHLVLSQTIPVIYLSSTIVIGGFQLLLNKPYFVFVDENKLDSELPMTVKLVIRYTNELKGAMTKAKKAETGLELEKMMVKCKKALMESGLSEDEAHQRILKTAMDGHLNKQDACLKILAEFKEESH
jgi:hypothetical protein